MNNKRNEISFFGIGTLGYGIFITVSIFIILGGGFVSIPKLIKWDITSWQSTVCFNLGAAFFSSAILTCTLDLASQSQRKKDLQNAIKKIQDASIDDVLEELVGNQKIFNEIRNYVIRRDFLRKNWIIKLRLEWYGEEKKYLKKEMEYNYEIHNISSKIIDYSIVAMEEKECEDQYPNTTKFNNFWYQIKSNISSVAEYSINDKKQEFPEDKISDYVKEESRLFNTLKLENKVKIPPYSRLLCGWKSESIVDCQLRYPLISLINSTSLEIDITEHPDDLDIDFRPLHPNLDSAEEKANDTHTKRWIINAGILPGQGIQIEWKPKNSAPQE